MEAKAVEKYLMMSPRKVKYIIDMVKDKKVEEAMDILTFTHRQAAGAVRKAIQSASANAMENFKEYRVGQQDLFIKEIFVTEGPTLKRFKPRARGKADRILKRSSHITVFVTDGKDKATVEKERAAKKKAAKGKVVKEKAAKVNTAKERATGKTVKKEAKG
ncbi:MAG: 50S ribosomal protein L22 [Actinobacteria bacterium]|nr:50S ribosomal protein L22 [Actinomycetota bacterium]MBU4450486.1 50S ribosomal protein L22 [Actinomycetota bacterium]